jgi:glycosyltransferase involved in cell wall biosynthesis
LSLHGTAQTPGNESESSLEQRRTCRVTIIVPTRDRPVLLSHALEHIRSQSFRAFEVIVVDDGSGSETRAAYPGIWSGLDERFKLIELGTPGQPGIGPSSARNVAIERAAGDILAFCDDDDFWTSDTHLQMLVEVFDADPEVDLYIGNQTAVGCDGKVERRDWLPALVELVRGKTRSHERGYRLSIDELVRGGGFAQLNILSLRKSTAQVINGFWTYAPYEGDRDFFWRAVDAARGVFFNPDIVAQHNVPDPKRQVNWSRRFTQADRWMISAMVSQHIAMSVKHDAIRSLCHTYEGDIQRRLSQHLSGEGKHALGLHYARRALAARVSLKWALYTMALNLRQLMWGRAA